MIKHWYAVKKGHQNNVVVTSWTECENLVKGFKGAIYKGFPLHQKNQAYQFASDGKYKNQPTKKADRPNKNETTNERFNRLNPCTERKSYKDPFTGEDYHNRCVRRKHPVVITGENYKPHIGNSLPWGE